MRWVLPDFIQDVLPEEAALLERLRRDSLDLFRSHGYRYVVPPMIEHLDSLTIGAGHDLRLRTFTLVDQLSGRTLGLRADITPQAARIDAHLLNEEGVTRLCYCGSVLHARPTPFSTTRQPLQCGAELFGHAGIDADIEIIRLLGATLDQAGIDGWRLDIGHVGIFRALASEAGLDAADEERVFTLMQRKDIPALRDALAGLSASLSDALLQLPTLYGGAEVIAKARAVLPDIDGIGAALDDLAALGRALGGRAPGFDLAELRGFHYHSGVVFAAYGSALPVALAHGGRYDALGRAYGRARPATGFSFDLRALARCLPQSSGEGAILAPLDDDAALTAQVAALRAAGEQVLLALPGHAPDSWQRAGCTRQLVKKNHAWQVVALTMQEQS